MHHKAGGQLKHIICIKTYKILPREWRSLPQFIEVGVKVVRSGSEFLIIHYYNHSLKIIVLNYYSNSFGRSISGDGSLGRDYWSIGRGKKSLCFSRKILNLSIDLVYESYFLLEPYPCIMKRFYLSESYLWFEVLSIDFKSNLVLMAYLFTLYNW